VNEPTENTPAEQSEPPGKFRRATAWLRDTWSANTTFLAAGFGITAACLIVLVVLQAVELHKRYPITNWGDIPTAFGAVATLSAVAVALWQSIVIGRQAKREGIEAAQRFERELTSARELHAAEMTAADERHKAELEAQRKIAREQRVHLREQEFKLALIRVSRAATAYTHELATLVAETSRIVSLSTRQERDDALKPISKKLGALADDLHIEISGAHMLTNNEQLHATLDRITATGMQGPMAEVNFRNIAVMEGQTPNPAPIFMVQQALQQVIGETRRLAGDLLVTGWD
jgi:hypothetical protein